jgi:hypothetical protein
VWSPFGGGATKDDVRFVLGVCVVLIATGAIATWWFARDPRAHQKERLERGTDVRAPDDVPRDVVPECVPVWTRDDAGAETARDAAISIVGRRKVAGVGFPIGAFDVKGLAAFRYRETIDARVRDSVGDVVVVPCLDPQADGGVRTDAQCTLPWSAAMEVAECREL